MLLKLLIWKVFYVELDVVLNVLPTFLDFLYFASNILCHFDLFAQLEQGRHITEAVGSIPVWGIQLTVGIDDPCGFLLTKNILCICVYWEYLAGVSPVH